MSKMAKVEKRFFEIEEMRASEDDGKRTITGYAAVFNQLSENLGMFREVREKIAPGAFAESLKKDQQYAFWNHDIRTPLADTVSGTLRLSEDKKGLRFEMDLQDTTAGRDLWVNIKAGIVRKMSFGFNPITESVERPQTDADPILRTVERAELIEVSPVVFPAYPQTEVSARSLDDWAKAKVAEWEAEDSKSAPVGKPVEELRGHQAKIERDSKLQRDTIL